jgi:pre-mRNA-processing factor SLU7
MTHKLRDCVERPRAKGAKLTGRAIAADEKVQSVELDYEGKHDRYNGYDADSYARVVERYDKVEALKQQRLKEKELQRTFRREQKAKLRAEGGAVSDDSDDEAAAAADEDGDDDERLADADNAEFGQVTRRVRSAGGGASSSVRNLRIREDTAKYLLNLDVRSAHYDPKSRSMREDPTPNAAPGTRTFAGDNAHRLTGDASRFSELFVHAWEVGARGQDVHAQAAPSAAEELFRQYKAKKEALAGASRRSVLERYGNAASADAPPDGLLLGQSEAYAEYDASGRLLRGAERAPARSRWEEDVLVFNHAAVWGSWWDAGAWGYACCRSCVRGSYCTGAAGIAAAAAAGQLMASNVAAKEAAEEGKRAAAAAAAAAAVPAAAGGKAKPPKPGGGVTWGSDVPSDVALDAAKLAAALRAEEARTAAEAARGVAGGDERKRAYNSLSAGGSGEGGAVTEEEMEAWRLKRPRADDPLAQMAAPSEGGYDYV